MTAGIIAAHYVAATGGNLAAWLAAVNADTPWGAWEFTETSGTTFADSSGNARTITNDTGTPTLGQTGPDGATDAIIWGSGARARTAATIATSPCTIEAFVYLAALPANNTLIAGPGDANIFDKSLFIDASGLPHFYCYNGSSGQNLAGTTALALGVWHHLVGSVGAAGMKVRLDKVTGGTNGVTSSYSSAMNFYIHNDPGSMNGGGDIFNTSPLTIGPVAVFTSQLSDARTDAHKDALAP